MTPETMARRLHPVSVLALMFSGPQAPQAHAVVEEAMEAGTGAVLASRVEHGGVSYRLEVVR